MKNSKLKWTIYSKMQKFDITIDRDLFDYGYDILNVYIFLVLLSVVFSMIFGILKELLLFYVFFIPLRKNIGGFHFENKKACFICSAIMGVVSAGIIQAKLFVSIKWIITFLIMFINVCLLGCQQHPNKQLTSSEKNKYKRKGLFFIAIFMGFGIYFLQYKNLEMYNSIILTTLINYFSSVIMYMKNVLFLKKFENNMSI